MKGASDEQERCPACGGDAADNWFDRSLCPCDGTDWGVMHQRCANCGYADDCGFTRKESSRAAVSPADTTEAG